MAYNGSLTLTKWLSACTVDFNGIVDKYGARFFREAFRRYVLLARHSSTQLTRSQVERDREFKSNNWSVSVVFFFSCELAVGDLDTANVSVAVVRD